MNAQATTSVTDVTRDANLRFYGMDRDCELELVRRVRDGDRDAFVAVHVLFNARLFRFPGPPGEKPGRRRRPARGDMAAFRDTRRPARFRDAPRAVALRCRAQ